MNTSKETAQAIKEVAKERGKATGEMLSELGLNKNTLSSMTSRGSWLQADTLGRIAEYLNCSTDYLLGRTADTEKETPSLSEKEQQLLAAYKTHPELQLAIDKLLGIEEETETIRLAARSKDSDPISEIKAPISKVKAALADKSIKTDADL